MRLFGCCFFIRAINQLWVTKIESWKFVNVIQFFRRVKAWIRLLKIIRTSTSPIVRCRLEQKTRNIVIWVSISFFTSTGISIVIELALVNLLKLLRYFINSNNFVNFVFLFRQIGHVTLSTSLSAKVSKQSRETKFRSPKKSSFEQIKSRFNKNRRRLVTSRPVTEEEDSLHATTDLGGTTIPAENTS